MNNGSIRVQEKNLVLKIGTNVDINVWDESKYYGLISELTGNRYYQKDAIFTALNFFCSNQYQNTTQLAYENYTMNEDIKNTYVTFENFEKKLPFANYYTASIDMATGSGKSWVMYGISLIMLVEKLVDQVLILVPSITIEEELTKKFKEFASNNILNSFVDCPPPKIINGSESIIKGCICIENRDAIYKNSRSSILDSLRDKGNNTLLICDEVHHVYYSEENEWKKFVEMISFKYNIGLSGTCYYKDNSYFSNVIYRYSLKQAIEERRVKSIEYVSESNMPSKDEDKWKVIMNSHEGIKKQLNYLPLTLVVTSDIKMCNKIATEFKKFLMNEYRFSEEDVNEKVLIIHSKPDAALDRIRLKNVDLPNSRVEWIFSVSMLTEGWDVKRVFQIVPHEERAFNSKLLISQVLGRGLRIPNNWDFLNSGVPKVIVFNHSKWANNVKRLVDEVLEIERKITNSILENSKNNFELINVSYRPDKTFSKMKKEGTYKLFEKGYVILPTDNENETINANFVDIQNNRNRAWSTVISHKTYTPKEMAEIMWYRFEDIPDDKNEQLYKKYQSEWSIEKLEKMIKKSLEKSGNNEITEKLKQKFLSSMGVVFRQGNTIVDYQSKPNKFEKISTTNLKRDTVNGSSLKKEKVIFWTSITETYLSAEEKEFFKEVIDTTNSYRQLEIKNIYDYKSPQTFIIADSDPEKEFIKRLLNFKNSNIISWIKSNQSGFYSFEYSWRKGEHPQRGLFNPDFFIKSKNRIIVVEIKGNEQINNPDVENVGKYKAAIKHFEYINKKLKSKREKEKYKFTMLTPLNYEVFFKTLESNKISDIDNFMSELDVSINEIITHKK